MIRAEKLCRSCGVIRPHSDFGKDRSKANGLQSRCKGCARQLTAAWYVANRERVVVRNKAYRAADPIRRAAHLAVQRAVATGRLIAKDYCEECDSRRGIEAHHDDYTRKLDVRWLCRTCHREAHAAIKAGAL